jgi:hypothetical protein
MADTKKSVISRPKTKKSEKANIDPSDAVPATHVPTLYNNLPSTHVTDKNVIVR